MCSRFKVNFSVITMSTYMYIGPVGSMFRYIGVLQDPAPRTHTHTHKNVKKENRKF